MIYDQEGYEELYQAVADLPEKSQQVIDLYYFQDMSIKEIAHILGAGQSWVKISLYRGRKQLRKALEERGYGYEDFEEVTKRSKRKNLWKTIGLSSLIGFILLLIGVQTVK